MYASICTADCILNRRAMFGYSAVRLDSNYRQEVTAEAGFACAPDNHGSWETEGQAGPLREELHPMAYPSNRWEAGHLESARHVRVMCQTLGTDVQQSSVNSRTGLFEFGVIEILKSSKIVN